MTSCVNGVPRGVGCNFSPSGSNSKNINKTPMLIPILFHEVIINKCICHGFYFVHCIQFPKLGSSPKLGQLTVLYLFYSLFLPYMSYCCEVWGNTYKSNIECMYLLQKKVVRIVCGVGYREHTNELFSELRILKLIDIVKLRSACIMYKAHKKLLPNNLQLLISLDSTRGHITRQSNSNTFKQVFARTTLKSQCISVQGIKLWNSLENSINMKSAKNIFNVPKTV